MKLEVKAVLLVVVVVAAVMMAYIWFRAVNGASVGTIHVSGNIEATEVRLSFQVPGRISELLVDEGYAVSRGQTVARLDKEELTRQRDNAEAALERAQANYKWLKAEYGRAEALAQTGAMTIQQRDAAKNQLEMAEAELKLLAASLEIAMINLGYADLHSPIDGYVLVKSSEAGEVVQPGGTVFTIADLNDIWLTAYVIETDLGRVKLNRHVVVKADTYFNKVYEGRISFISEQAEFTPKQIQTLEERVRLVYRIKITIANTHQELKPGMPADGYIMVE
jgi:HlyD family secretion protein